MSSGDFGTLNVGGGVPEAMPAPRKNGLGVAGFIVSLVGFPCTCGLIAPIGLLLSIVAARRQPRGLAVAGIIISSVGTLCLLYAGVGIVRSGGIPAIKTGVTVALDGYTLQAYAAQHGGALPADWKSVITAAGYKTTDGWGHELRFQAAPSGSELRSAGADGKFGTADDIPYAMTIIPGGAPASGPAESGAATGGAGTPGE